MTIKKIRKYLILILGIIIFLMVFIWIFLNTSYGQNKVLPYALKQVSSAINTEVKASKINVSFFDEVILNDVLALDNKGDTLLFVEQVKTDISLFSFFGKKLGIDDLQLKNPKLFITEDEAGTYNFDHIVEHLSPSETKTSNDNTKSWEIDLDQLNFNGLELVFAQPGTQIVTNIASLSGDFKSFSIPNSLLHFNQLNINGISGDFSSESKSTTTESVISFPGLPITLMADKLNIDGNGITYTKTNSATINSKDLVNINEIDLNATNFYWNDSIHIELEDSSVELAEEKYTFKASGISMSNQRLDLADAHIASDDSRLNLTLNSSYSDFNSLLKDFLNTDTKINFADSKISKSDLRKAFGNDGIQSVNIDAIEDINVEGTAEFNNGSIRLRSMDISSGSGLSVKGSASISNVSTERPSSIQFDIPRLAVNQSYLQRILPDLKLPNEIENQGYITGSVVGQAMKDEVKFGHINIKTSKGQSIKGSGSLYNINSIKDLKFDLKLDRVFANVDNLFKEESTIPDPLQRLSSIEYNGTLTGSIFDFVADGDISTGLGSLTLDSEMSFNDDFTDATYEGYFKLQDFDIGYMLNDTLFGISNFEGNINGSGLKLEDLAANIDGRVSSFCFDGYIYENISLDGNFQDSVFIGKLKSTDPNFYVDLNGKIDLRGDKSMLDVVINLENVDLKELGFTNENMRIGGIFTGRVEGRSIDDFFGRGKIENFRVATDKGYYSSDSLITFRSQELNANAKAFAFDSPFIKGEIKGKIQPSKLVRYVKNYIKAYIPLEIGYDEDISENLDQYFAENEDQNFVFSIRTKKINEILKPFFGDELNVKYARLGAYFSSEETRLDIKGNIDSLLYKGILFQRGSYFFDGRKSFINGNVNLEDITVDNEILVPYTTVNTVLNNKIANFNLVLANELDVERFNLWGDLSRTDEYIITLNDSVYLNGSDWKFSPYNQIIFGDYGLYLQDLKMSKDNQAITIYTDENENGEAIEVLFDDFHLAELFAIIDKENEFFDGNIDGSLLINSVFSKPFVTANLDINDIAVSGNPVGALSIQSSQNSKTNVVSNNLLLVGPLNNASLTLDYGINDFSTKGELNIQNLEMSVIDPYLTNVFVDSEGYVSGLIKINGDLNNLDLKGSLNTHNIKTTPVFTNSRYIVSDSEIKFTDKEIDFGSVSLTDRIGNVAQVKGKIHHKNLRSSILDLGVKAENFELLNTTSDENELYFGNVKITGNATVYGPIDDIEIAGSVTAVDNSKLSVSPLSIESEIYSDDFIIYSGDPRIIPFDSLELDFEPQKAAIPFDIDIKVNIKDDSEFSMILNPITGDKLTCIGTSDLILKLNKAGEMQLFGTYTVSAGVYTFSYGLITKEFIIQPGSTVTFNGDPLEGVLQVDAVYVANTSVYDLLKLESDLNDAQKSEAQRKRPINVALNLTNKILKPTIKLDITAQEDDLSSISDILERKLVQLRTEPDELNNQVFGLLLFNNFILARNAETDLADTGTDLAISSISSLITSQLNKLADGIMEGFEVNFGINSYSSDYLALGEEGVITELGVGVKQTLFDNRLTISAGTNINLESTSEQSNFNTIAGDFILEYKLNKNGNYVIKAFRKSSYDRLIDENASKNGASFFVRKEFGTIKKKEKEN